MHGFRKEHRLPEPRPWRRHRVIIDGNLYYGKSGFAGEFGHTPYFDNEIICDCGKKGCLETEVSGIAIENKMIQQIKNGRTTI